MHGTIYDSILNLDTAADANDFTNSFVTQSDALRNVVHCAAQKMKIRATDGRFAYPTIASCGNMISGVFGRDR